MSPAYLPTFTTKINHSCDGWEWTQNHPNPTVLLEPVTNCIRNSETTWDEQKKPPIPCHPRKAIDTTASLWGGQRIFLMFVRYFQARVVEISHGKNGILFVSSKDRQFRCPNKGGRQTLWQDDLKDIVSTPLLCCLKNSRTPPSSFCSLSSPWIHSAASCEMLWLSVLPFASCSCLARTSWEETSVSQTSWQKVSHSASLVETAEVPTCCHAPSSKKICACQIGFHL